MHQELFRELMVLPYLLNLSLLGLDEQREAEIWDLALSLQTFIFPIREDLVHKQIMRHCLAKVHALPEQVFNKVFFRGQISIFLNGLKLI